MMGWKWKNALRSILWSMFWCFLEEFLDYFWASHYWVSLKSFIIPQFIYSGSLTDQDHKKSMTHWMRQQLTKFSTPNIGWLVILHATYYVHTFFYNFNLLLYQQIEAMRHIIRTVRIFLREFCLQSNIHGLKYFSERRLHWSERLAIDDLVSKVLFYIHIYSLFKNLVVNCHWCFIFVVRFNGLHQMA